MYMILRTYCSFSVCYFFVYKVMNALISLHYNDNWLKVVEVVRFSRTFHENNPDVEIKYDYSCWKIIIIFEPYCPVRLGSTSSIELFALDKLLLCYIFFYGLCNNSVDDGHRCPIQNKHVWSANCNCAKSHKKSRSINFRIISHIASRNSADNIIAKSNNV